MIIIAKLIVIAMIKKEIVINSEKNLDKFYKKVKFYKSIVYKFTFFYSDNDEIGDIIEALNIKNRYKRISFIYDNVCSIIDSYVANKNFCGFKNHKCLTQQKEGCKYKNGCCRRCLYQSNKGCTTSNLTCKFFYCEKVKQKHKILTMDDIKILRCFSCRQREIVRHDYFSSREEVISDLYVGSLIIFTIRIIFRNMKRIIKLNK